MEARSAAASAESVRSGSSTKRHANDALENEQPLTKRLSLLTIGKNGPIRSPAAARRPRRPRQSNATSDGDSMRVDDTKHRIFIHNIDDELSESESDKEQVTFLPDIEKRLNKIPKSVLVHPAQSEAAKMELILYNVPPSLTVPEEQDSTRKVIVEARSRAQEASSKAGLPDQSRADFDTLDSGSGADAMDLDD